MQKDNTQVQAFSQEPVWLTSKEAANWWGCSNQNMAYILRTNVEKYQDGMKLVAGRGGKGLQWRVSKECLVKMRNELNIGKVSRKSDFHEGKRQIAEKAIEAYKPSKLMQELSDRKSVV